MFSHKTSTTIDQIINKALEFLMPAQDDATIEDTAQVMRHLQDHFADPIYGLRSGYVIGSMADDHNSHHVLH